ncbi:MAG TPA: Holliday junction resolvase RuvX [Candidatus Saccharimonadales bacterium]|nr:Holliday junction resolvase RuvX [Candidatus Saccharimonadales bacterium]
MEANEYIGVDVGKARTGLARGSRLARLAETLKTVPTEQAIAEIEKLANKNLAGVVVGLPRNLKGEDTEQTKWVRDWVDSAKQKINATFYWQDEALTSKLAEAKILAGGTVNNVDSLAAQIILQDFFDSPESLRVVC